MVLNFISAYGHLNYSSSLIGIQEREGNARATEAKRTKNNDNVSRLSWNVASHNWNEVLVRPNRASGIIPRKKDNLSRLDQIASRLPLFRPAKCT